MSIPGTCHVCGFALRTRPQEPGRAYCPGLGSFGCLQIGYDRQRSLARSRAQEIEHVRLILRDWLWFSSQDVQDAEAHFRPVVEHHASCFAPAYALTPADKKTVHVRC